MIYLLYDKNSKAKQKSRKISASEKTRKRMQTHMNRQNTSKRYILEAPVNKIPSILLKNCRRELFTVTFEFISCFICTNCEEPLGGFHESRLVNLEILYSLPYRHITVAVSDYGQNFIENMY